MMTRLSSDSVLLRVPTAIAEEVISADSAAGIRPQPSVRAADLPGIAALLVFTTHLAADGVTLILARDHLNLFVRRLLGAMRGRGYEELTVSYKSRDGSDIHLTVRSQDEATDVTRMLASAIDVIRAADDDPARR